jgi:hypothetical protein
MNVLNTLAIVRTIQKICNACARVQLVRAHPFDTATCKYCGNVMPAKKPEHSARFRPGGGT